MKLTCLAESGEKYGANFDLELMERNGSQGPPLAVRWQRNEEGGEEGALVCVTGTKCTKCFIEYIVNENPVVSKKKGGQSDAMPG